MLFLVTATSLVLAIPVALLGLAKLGNLAELALPLTAIAALPAITAATWLARRVLDRRSFQSLGLELGPRTGLDLLVGFLLPGPLFGLIFLLFTAAGWLQFDSWTWGPSELPSALLNLFVIGVAFVAVGFYEEPLFRGYYLRNLIEGINLPAALLISSSAFGVAHLSNFGASWASTLGIVMAGFFLAYAWYRGGSLWLPIGVHIGWNFFQGPVFGFAVSGTATPTLIEHTVNGPQLITGGAFGPEAGLIVIPIMALGSGMIWLYTRDRSDRKPAYADSADAPPPSP